MTATDFSDAGDDVAVTELQQTPAEAATAATQLRRCEAWKDLALSKYVAGRPPPCGVGEENLYSCIWGFLLSG